MMDVETLKQFITDAEQGKPELPADILNVEGFSSPKIKRLLNALCSQPDARYLEIGVHIGSTLIPALYGNTAAATCIDNWQMFEGAREKFRENLKRLLPARKIKIIDSDCFAADVEKIVPDGVTVYFYDGAHTAEAQYNGITRFAPVLADRFVLLVDDCNWEEPREETKRALAYLKYRVLYSVLLPGVFNGDTSGWWNGLYVGLVEK